MIGGNRQNVSKQSKAVKQDYAGGKINVIGQTLTVMGQTSVELCEPYKRQSKVLKVFVCIRRLIQWGWPQATFENTYFQNFYLFSFDESRKCKDFASIRAWAQKERCINLAKCPD